MGRASDPSAAQQPGARTSSRKVSTRLAGGQHAQAGRAWLRAWLPRATPPCAHWLQLTPVMPRPTTGRRPSGAGFICEPATLEGATDIAGLGGWRAWLASCASDPV